jgi:hypothetical protein
MLLLYCQFLRHIHKIITCDFRWLHSIFLPTKFFNNKLLLSMILQLLSKLLHAYFEFLYRNTFIFSFSLYSVGIHRNAHCVILVLTFQSKLNHLAVSRVRKSEMYLKYTFLCAFLWSSLDTIIMFFDKENCSFKLSNLQCFYITGARGTDLPPPLFSNFLFTNLFSIQFLYFFITSSLFTYFNLFVSIFIQSYVNIKLHVSTLYRY